MFLFSLLHVGKKDSHFHEFNNVQNQIHTSEEILAEVTAGNHSPTVFKILKWT